MSAPVPEPPPAFAVAAASISTGTTTIPSAAATIPGAAAVLQPGRDEDLRREQRSCKTRLSNSQRQRIVEAILPYAKKKHSGEYTAQKAIISKVADEFNVSRRSIGDIWSRGRKYPKDNHQITSCCTRNIIWPTLKWILTELVSQRDSSPRSIVLQQDNARPHISGTNQDFMTAGNANGFNITLSNQPPNSPDLNILDLGFFRAIQSLKEKCAPKNVAELVEAVRGAYAALTAETLNKVWLSYQDVMQQVMNDEGGNKYKLPHMAKDRLARQGALPVCLNVPHTLVEKAVRVLAQATGQSEQQDQPEFMPEDGEDFSSSEMN
ncbi:unnamed protein product [Cuscuta campestris]|uniref:DUF7769 domain-containing protein n=1 Tax=Cuscuta campestris TaxID=132261 RepID=A0A484L7M4_9ASTE|nr:unnamed protein product [Cuscuta campestris]